MVLECKYCVYLCNVPPLFFFHCSYQFKPLGGGDITHIIFLLLSLCYRAETVTFPGH